jgi:hypothetical protein
MKKLVIGITVALLFISCTINFKIITILDSYNLLSPEDKNSIVLLTNKDTLPAVFDTTLFYALTVEQIKQYMGNDSCLIYFWSLWCHGTWCLSPVIYQQYCKDHNYRFILILDDHYHAIKKAAPFRSQLEAPIFMINYFCYNGEREPFRKSLHGERFKQLKKEKSIGSYCWLYKDNVFYDLRKKIDVEELINPTPMKTKVIKEKN